MFQFAHPYFLYFFLVIPVIVVLFWLSNQRKKKLLAEFGDRQIIEELMPNRSTVRPVLKLTVLLTALAFFILALAGPEFGAKLRENKRKGIEIIIALDVSNSMLAQDIQPNRLERAKQAIAKLVDQLSDDKIGLIVFAGKAYTQLPITTDYVSAKMFLQNINCNSVPVPGTAIGAAINLAASSFTPDTKGDKAIVVITDGENHEDNAVEMAKSAHEKNIYVHTIGIGTPQGAPIVMGNGPNAYLRDETGNTVVSKLDEEGLQKIAEAGNGIYVRANNTQIGLNKIFDEIKKLNKSEIKTRVYSEYENQFQWPLAVALILFIVEIVIIERKTRWSDKFRLFQ